jgi:hypothetical protein
LAILCSVAAIDGSDAFVRAFVCSATIPRSPS